MSSEFSLPHRGVVPELSLSAEMPQDAEALVVPVFQGEDGLDLPESEFFDGATVRAALDMLGATGAAEEVTKVPASTGPIVAVGVGKRDDVDAEKLRRAAGVAARSLTGLKVVATTLGELGLAAAVEGIALGAYTYRGLKTPDVPEDQQPVKKVVFLGKDQALFDAAVITAEAVAFARDLVNAPSSHLFPESYAAIATSAAEDNGLTVEVVDDAALAEQGFGGMGMNRRFARRDLLAFNGNIDGTLALRRHDTGATAEINYHAQRVPFAPQMAEVMPKAVSGTASDEELRLFKELWQGRTRAILIDHADDDELIEIRLK